MDLTSKDLILNTDDEESVDGLEEEMKDPEEFKEEVFPGEDSEDA